MYFIPRHIIPENFMQIDQMHFELSRLASIHLARLRLEDFFKKSSVLTFVS